MRRSLRIRFTWTDWVLIIAAAVQAIFILSAGLSIRHFVNAHREAIRYEVAKLRKAGQPTTSVELNAFYHNDPESDRLGVEIVKILDDQYDATLENTDGVPIYDRRRKLGEQPFESNIAKLRAHSSNNANYLAQLHSLLQSSHEIRYPMDLTRGYNTEFPFLAKIRNAERMFGAEAQLAVDDLDAERAVRSLIDGVRVAESLRWDPMIIQQLVRIACHSIVEEQMEFAINNLTLSSSEITALRDTLAVIRLNGMIAYGLSGERCIGDIRDLIESSPKFKEWRYVPGFVDDYWNQKFFLACGPLIDIGLLEPWIRRRAVDQFDQALSREHFIVHPLELTVLPAMGHAYEAESRAVAENAIARVGLSILLYALNLHELPGGLTDLVPKYTDAVPLDPFDGRPLQYKRSDKGFVVYSIGHDLDDDGGNPPPRGIRITKDGDIVFRVLDAGAYLQSK